MTGALCQAQGRAHPNDILSMYLFNGSDEASFRRQLERSAQIRIDRIAEVVELDAAQLSKLELANHGDLCRFYRDLAHLRQKVKGLDPQNHNDFQAAWAHIGPIQQRLNEGIIDENSLSERILKNLLNDQQQMRYQHFQHERENAQLHALLRISVAELERVVPLTEKQRTELVKLLEQSLLADGGTPDQHQLAVYGNILLAQLPDQELEKLLDEHQRLAFSKFIAPFKNFRLRP